MVQIPPVQVSLVVRAEPGRYGRSIMDLSPEQMTAAAFPEDHAADDLMLAATKSVLRMQCRIPGEHIRVLGGWGSVVQVSLPVVRFVELFGVNPELADGKYWRLPEGVTDLKVPDELVCLVAGASLVQPAIPM